MEYVMFISVKKIEILDYSKKFQCIFTKQYKGIPFCWSIDGLVSGDHVPAIGPALVVLKIGELQNHPQTADRWPYGYKSKSLYSRYPIIAD